MPPEPGFGGVEQGRHRIGGLGRLVAENQQALAGPPAEPALQLNRFLDRGKGQDSTLFGGLDDVGAHPVDIDPADLGETGSKTGCRVAAPIFHRLLHHVVEPGVFERRKHAAQVGQAVLGSRLAQDVQAIGPFAAGDRGLPFAVASVEHQHSGADCKTQNIAEIIALVAVERHTGAGARAASTNSRGLRKIEFRHG